MTAFLASKYKRMAFSQRPFAERRRLAEAIKGQYPDRVPLVIETTRNGPEFKKYKFLVPGDMTLGRVITEMRAHRVEDGTVAAHAYFFMLRDTRGNWIVPPICEQISIVARRYQQTDGFLYIRCQREATFG